MADKIDARPTRNIRNPMSVRLPSIGRVIVLADGRRGWVAGQGTLAGRLTFVDSTTRKATDLWPAQFEGYMESV